MEAAAQQQQQYNFVEETLVFYLNGERIELQASEVDPQMPLAEFIRGRGLTGTKVGCSEGGCGACTVVVTHWDAAQQRAVHRGVAACLLPLPYVAGMLVTTVEGLARPGALGRLVTEQLARKHAAQCGYCTPGIAMSLLATVARRPDATMAEVEAGLDGNLCRCTGYRPILDAAHALGRDYDAARDDGRLSAEPALPRVPVADVVASTLVLPDELRCEPRPLRLAGPRGAWYRPASLRELLELKGAVPSAQVLGGHHSWPEGTTFDAPQLISGNTEIGYQTRYHPPARPAYRTFVSTAAVAELRAVAHEQAGTRVGVATTINGLAEVLSRPEARPDEGTRAVRSILRRFANNQVRDMGTMGGSLVTCDPLSDLYPPLVALGAKFRIISKARGQRDIEADKFVLGENRVDLQPDEVLLSAFIPHTRPNEFVETYKQGKRRSDAQSVVNAGLRVRLDDQKKSVLDCTLCFGAVARRPAQRFAKTEQALTGKEWTEENILAACAVARAEAQELVVASRGLTEYRVSVVPSLLYRFFVAVSLRAGIPVPPRTEHTPEPAEYDEQPHRGQQEYQDRWSPDKVLGSTAPHIHAMPLASGKALFVADEPFHGLHAALALARRGHARILSIDTSEALRMPGVRGCYTAKDIPGSNLLGSIVADEEVLASKEVVFFAQPVAIVVADTHRQAQAASLRVKVEYEDMPIVGTIEEAIAAKSFYGEDKVLQRGDPDAVFASAAQNSELTVLSGQVRVGGQEHWYLEPVAATVWPSTDKVVVHSTTQNPSKVQRAVASVLGLSYNAVESSMERIGGGFGGKQDRPQFMAAVTAIAAHNCGRPVRLVLERDTDMQITGQRHEFLIRYRVAHKKTDGAIEAFEAELYNNGGCSLDLSPAVMEVALFHIDNVYHVPNCRYIGRCCRTNRPSCTAYRGFGKPQAIAAVESIIDHIAHSCGVPAIDVRVRNMLHAGQAMIDGEVVDECLERCWAPLERLYRERIGAVERFNAENRWRKRGLALLPAKNNIGFETDWMNQGGALVHVYTDGSVHVSHGGTEMGQGLHTKVAQLVADEFGIPLGMVSVGRSGTERVPNTHPTAACTGTEINCGAALDATRQILAAVAPVREDLAKKLGREPQWKEIVSEAYIRRINLSASGHYAMPQFTYNWETHTGLASLYRIWGAALCEVELDVLTGEWRVLRTDIFQDNGSGLNPAIDIGQVEGGFIQGMGLFTLEELLWARDGHLRTRNVSTYKIPAYDDAPLVFNVSLLRGVTNPRGSKGNKTVGEAGLQLGIAVVHAIKEAVYAARRELLGPEQGSAFFQLDTPTTVERVRLSIPTPFDH